MSAICLAANWRWSLLATWILAHYLHCSASPLPDVCLQNFPGGSCGELEERFYYDGDTRECRRFHWQGCPAASELNLGNMFMTLQECIETCNGTEASTETPRFIYPSPETVQISPPENYQFSLESCLLLPDSGIAHPDVQGPFLHYYFNSTSQQCEQFIFFGVQGNPNNFNSITICQRKCACFLPLVPGVGFFGFGGEQRHYFNIISRQCEEFTFLGPKGNDNNFQDEQQCLDTCGDLIPSTSGDTENDITPTDHGDGGTSITVTLPNWINTIPPLSDPNPSPILDATSFTSAPFSDVFPTPYGGKEDDTPGDSGKEDDAPGATPATTNDTEPPVQMGEEDKGISQLFLYASVAVALLVTLVSLAAVLIGLLMLYRYQTRKRIDVKLKDDGHKAEPRKTLPSISTCSSSVSV